MQNQARSQTEQYFYDCNGLNKTNETVEGETYMQENNDNAGQMPYPKGNPE